MTFRRFQLRPADALSCSDYYESNPRPIDKGRAAVHDIGRMKKRGTASGRAKRTGLSLADENRLRRTVSASRRIVVLGIGNPDRGDDGAGVAVARSLEKRPSVIAARSRPEGRALKITLGRETPESVTGEIRSFAPDLVILVDAAAGGRPPGAVFLVPPERIAVEDVSTHRLPLGLLLRYLEEDIGTKTLVFAVQPGMNQSGRKLSAPVRAGVESMAELLSSLFFPAG
jgi:hydrogenase 3 maturation protease